MIFVALVAVAATACGVTCERRCDGAPRAGRGVLTLMLYVLVPFVSFVNIAHLRLTTGAAAGLGLAYIAVGVACITALIIRMPSTYVLQAAMPTGVNTLIVGHAYGLDLRFIATAIVWSTAAVLLAGLVISLA